MHRREAAPEARPARCSCTAAIDARRSAVGLRRAAARRPARRRGRRGRPPAAAALCGEAAPALPWRTPPGPSPSSSTLTSAPLAVERRGSRRRGRSAAANRQRRLAFDRFLGVDVGALREQRLDGVGVAGLRPRASARVVPFIVGALASAPAGGQRLDHRGVAVLRWRSAAACSRRCASSPSTLAPGVEQRSGELDVALLRGPVQRGHAVGLRRVDVGALASGRSRTASRVAVHRRVDDATAGGAASSQRAGRATTRRSRPVGD